MIRAAGNLVPLKELVSLGGAPVPAVATPSWFTNDVEITYTGAALPAAAYLVIVAKANYVASSEYVLITTAAAVTHAFWFDTTGSDSEPAGSQAADFSYQVNISADTTAQTVLNRLLTAINTASIGVTAKDYGSANLIIEVDAAGAAGNSWGIAEFVADVTFEAGGGASGVAGTSFDGGINTTTIITDGQSFWVGDMDQVTPTVLTFSVRNSGQLLLTLDPTPVATVNNNVTPTPTQPTDLDLESGVSDTFSLSCVALSAAAYDFDMTFDSDATGKNTLTFTFLGIGV